MCEIGSDSVSNVLQSELWFPSAEWAVLDCKLTHQVSQLPQRSWSENWTWSGPGGARDCLQGPVFVGARTPLSVQLHPTSLLTQSLSFFQQLNNGWITSCSPVRYGSEVRLTFYSLLLLSWSLEHLVRLPVADGGEFLSSWAGSQYISRDGAWFHTMRSTHSVPDTSRSLVYTGVSFKLLQLSYWSIWYRKA